MTTEDWIRKTITVEGGYVNDPVDPGGETKYGISKRSYPGVDIKNLSEATAIQIYKVDYWDKIAPDVQVGDDRLKWKVFDAGVNMGVDTAAALYAEAITRIAATAPPPWSDDLLLHEFAAAQMRHYCKIVKRNPKMLKYLSGWTNRAMTIQ